VIEDEPLGDIGARPSAPDDDVLLLVDARVARARSTGSRRALAVVVAMVLAIAAIGLALVTSHTSAPPRSETPMPAPASPADPPALVVGARRVEASDRVRSRDRTR
jgi:hypothetical protein